MQPGNPPQDSSNGLGIVIKDIPVSISYSKTNKLITALYMVTDIIDKEEPLRKKLRTLGAEIISDIHSLSRAAQGRITEVLSFLEIASAMAIISEMNCNILRKEFVELSSSIKDSFDEDVSLSNFFKKELLSIGHTTTRIGVQKGGTLMQALSDKTHHLSSGDKVPNPLKQERRDGIISVIKDKGGNASIKDITTSNSPVLISCGEKTIQRELISMVGERVLNKTGEKRWSRYSLAPKT